MDLLELESGVDPKKHWYYQTKKIPLINFIQSVVKIHDHINIVDIGSGSGFFGYEIEEAFSQKIKKIYLVDINYSQLDIESTINSKIQKVKYIPAENDFTVFVMMDVLEHLENDLAMLNDIKKTIKSSNNFFFITVPAFNSLWSGHDVFLGHFRRYKIKLLQNLLDKADFKVCNIHYLYGILFPLAFLVRKISVLLKKERASNMSSVNPILNGILKFIIKSEMKVAKWNKLFGITCSANGMIKNSVVHNMN